MANGGGGGGGEKSGDFYAVLGLKKECTDSDLKNAYKKLAMRWHPDRCSASGNSKFVEEAKEKFQEIQEAYSVLSDSNKRFLYDVGVYDGDDDENQGMGDFLGEMAEMMSQTNPNEGGGHESFEDLQQLFVDMFQSDLDGGFGGGPTAQWGRTDGRDRFSASASSSSSSSSCNGSVFGGNKRDNSAMDSVSAGTAGFGSASGAFCFGSNDSGKFSKGRGGGGGGSDGNNSSNGRRKGRKQKVSARHDVSSRDAEISAGYFN